MNPIISLLNQRNPMLEMLRPLYNALQGSTNEMEALGKVAMRDERMKQVISTINQNGGIERAVYAEAQKLGVSPDYALKQAQQMIQSLNMK